MFLPFLLIVSMLGCASPLDTGAQTQAAAARLRVAVLDLHASETGRRAADALSTALAAENSVEMIDREQSQAAARGVGYAGSLNMSLLEARDLAAAIDCDFLITGDAQTLRRSSSARPVYYEAYASVFIVSGSTGRLVHWQHFSKEAATPQEAEKLLLEDLSRRDLAYSYRVQLARTREDEGQLRQRASAGDAEGANVFEDEPEEGSAAAASYRPPQPYRRLRPVYTEAAARAEVEATVDVSVEIDAAGEVRGVRVLRWAGFGLDESVTDTVRQLHFRPAARDGVPFAVRVLLRYNFRRPPKSR